MKNKELTFEYINEVLREMPEWKKKMLLYPWLNQYKSLRGLIIKENTMDGN